MAGMIFNIIIKSLIFGENVNILSKYIAAFTFYHVFNDASDRQGLFTDKKMLFFKKIFSVCPLNFHYITAQSIILYHKYL